MTLELQAALPEDLARKIEAAAARRGLLLWDCLSLLTGMAVSPEIRLSEDRTVRELSDELMLHFQGEALRLEHRRREVSPSATTASLLKELRNRPVPKSLDDLKPVLQPPPGKTIRDMLPRDPWPGEETDEELLAALKAMG